VEVGSSSDGVECRRRETPRLDSCGSSRAFGQPKEIAQRRGGFIASKAGEDHPLDESVPVRLEWLQKSKRGVLAQRSVSPHIRARES